MLNVSTTWEKPAAKAARPVRLAFFDPLGWDYHALTVLEKPLGGTQSAVCYLSRALAQRGHDVTLFTGVSAPGVYGGVRCINSTQFSSAVRTLNFDFCIGMMGPDPAVQLRPALGSACRLALWISHADDQRAVRNLAHPEVRAFFDAIIFVSQWQAAQFQKIFGVEPARTAVLRYAIAPAFENLFPEGRAITSDKPWPTVLAYTSTPFRGLDLLLEAFPRIRAAVPGTRLRVYSSMAVYQTLPSADHAEYGALYDRCQNTEGVEYIGSLPQPALARALCGVTALAYPNTFAETSCISIMEAMAAGCRVITSRLGALPETTAGFADLVPIIDATRDGYLDEFVRSVVAALQFQRQQPKQADEMLRRQVNYLNSQMTWAIRAAEWERWMQSKLNP